MSSRIIALSDRVRSNGHVMENAVPAPRHLHEWDVDVVAMLTIDAGEVPNVACVRWAIDLDPRRQRLDVAVQREDQDYPMILHNTFRIGESPQRTAQRAMLLRFFNELLAASYGVPA